MRTTNKVVQKLWGREVWIANSPSYCGKILYLRPGFQCSLHKHPRKSESFHVLTGAVGLDVEEDGVLVKLLLAEGDTYHIPPGTPHRFRAMFGKSASIMEVSTEHSDEDVVRLEESSAVIPVGEK